MVWIHEHESWPQFSWDAAGLASKLAGVRHRQGCLLGRMESLGFELRREASLSTLTSDVLKSSAIEGKALDPAEVRSLLARRLGIELGGMVPAGRDMEGIVEVMLDATQHKCSTDTALRDIGELWDRGVLIRNPGGGRSTSYRLPRGEELEHLVRRD